MEPQEYPPSVSLMHETAFFRSSVTRPRSSSVTQLPFCMITVSSRAEYNALGRVDGRQYICYIMDMSKTFNINCRIDPKYRDIIDYLKLQEGGITGFVERKFEEAMDSMTDGDWNLLRAVRKMAKK